MILVSGMLTIDREEMESGKAHVCTIANDGELEITMT
jgi:hypothetical protein